MAEKYRFFDAVQDENGQYDREYNAQEFTDYFKALVTTGVMKGAGSELAVTANGSNMITTINTGIAFLLGRYYENDSPLTLTHDTETLGNSRIDRIVVRMDLSTEARYVRAFIKKGVPSTNPVAPTLTQTPNLYEISLAQVKVVGGQTFIAANAVTDERGKDVVCPWAGSNILPNFDDSSVGKPNGIATLDETGSIPMEQLQNVPLPQDASTTRKGVVQLNDTLNSTSTIQAPTANAVKQLNDLKATKTQENYLNLTLVNNWKVGYYARFYKDEFGVVHIRATVNGGTVTSGTIIATLPAGYRPSNPINQFIVFGSTDDSTYTPVVLNVTSGGIISFYSPGKTWMIIDISFRM